MGILTRYIFRGILINCFYLITISVSLIWIIQAIQYLKILINHPISIGSVLYLTLLLVPGILVYVIPFTFCVGATLFYKQFDDTNELTILPMLGMRSMYKPLLFCAAIMTALQVFSQFVTPIATKDFFVREAEIRKQISLKIFKPKQFNHHEGATIFFQRLEDYTIHDLFLAYKNSFIFAQSAHLVYDAKQGYNLIIKNGVTIDETEGQKTRISFDNMEYNIGSVLPTPKKSHKLMSMTFKELYQDYSYESRYEIVSRYVRMVLPFLNSLVLYLFLFILPLSSRFLWGSLGTSAFNALMITAGTILTYFI